MELQFKKNSISCLETALREVQNIEETQELRLTDGMPDIGRILSAWGQVILRGKEWHSDTITLSAGMMVWVLYLPEDGTAPRCMDTWIPFQVKWDLPNNTPEGDIRIECLIRFVDARSVSARKIMLRAGIAAMAEAYVPTSENIFVPENIPEDVELLRVTYPLRLPKEAGEKTFLMDEDLSLPGSVPQPEKLIYYRLTPIVTDQKVMANKVVFRGSGNLHLLYASEDGQLHSWDFELPFSQFADLNHDHSNEAEGDVLLGTTSLEMDMNDEGQMHMKCGLVGQYLVTDMEVLELIEDAYSTKRELETEDEELELPAILETRRENLYGEQTLPVDANLAADVQFLPDFPRQRRMDDVIRLEVPGSYQVLFYGADGSLQAANARWEGTMDIPSHPDSRLAAIPVTTGQPQITLGSGSATVRSETGMQLTTTSERGIPMVTGLEIGEEREPGVNRPSLILRRAGDVRLWDMAKMSGSTVEAIKQANNLQEEPAIGQMLLIPVS